MAIVTIESDGVPIVTSTRTVGRGATVGPITTKQYRHGCGKEQPQSTNHWGPTYGPCPSCRGHTEWTCLETQFEGIMKFTAAHGRPPTLR